MKRHMQTFLADDQAATAAEFALVVPVFLLLMFATINGSIMMSAITQMHYASERAARCLSVDVDNLCPPGSIDTYAKGLYDGPSLVGMSFVADDLACGSQVVASGTYELVSGIEVTSVSLSSTACYPKI
jgi:Flp pilus assembly pilin Flp